MDSLGLPSEPALYTSDIQIIVIIMSKAAGESSMYSQFQKPPTRKKAGGGGRGGGGEGGGEYYLLLGLRMVSVSCRTCRTPQACHAKPQNGKVQCLTA